MDAALLRELCLGFPGAYEDFPFGPEASVFKVRSTAGGDDWSGKMFALANLVGAGSVDLKCRALHGGR